MRVVHGVKLIAQGDRVVFNDVNDPGGFEPQSVAAWLAAMVPGQVAIDVGAYSGLYAILAAKAGAHAVAYEPNPTAFARLIENAERNGVPMDARSIAAYDTHGDASFWIKDGAGMTSAGRLSPREGATEIRVKTAPVVELRTVCAIKVDVEGAEIPVLRGADEILRRDRPLVIAEALGDASLRMLVNFMGARGYDWRKADKYNVIFNYVGPAHD